MLLRKFEEFLKLLALYGLLLPLFNYLQQGWYVDVSAADWFLSKERFKALEFRSSNRHKASLLDY